MKNLGQKELKVLKELGLTDTQITLYLTSLKSGILSVLELSKLTKINRQQIYEQTKQETKIIDFYCRL